MNYALYKKDFNELPHFEKNIKPGKAKNEEPERLKRRSLKSRWEKKVQREKNLDSMYKHIIERLSDEKAAFTKEGILGAYEDYITGLRRIGIDVGIDYSAFNEAFRRMTTTNRIKEAGSATFDKPTEFYSFSQLERQVNRGNISQLRHEQSELLRTLKALPAGTRFDYGMDGVSSVVLTESGEYRTSAQGIERLKPVAEKYYLPHTF